MADMTPLSAPPPLPGSTPGQLQCAMCIYKGETRNPQVITIMGGYASCRTHLPYFNRELQTILIEENI